jgi:tetratricopeptide (TPR) repeat protein
MTADPSTSRPGRHDADDPIDNARSLGRVGEADEAEAVLRAGLESNPDDVSLVRELGSLVGSVGRYEEALELFERAVAIDGDHSGAQRGKAKSLRLLGRLAEAEATVRAALESHPNDLRILIELGYVLSAQRRYEDAMAAFDRALRVDAGDLHAVEGKARSLRLLGRLAEAEATVRAALESHPNEPWLLVQLGSLANMQGRHDDAIALADQVLMANASDAQALSIKAESLRLLGRIHEAEAILRTWIESHPDDPWFLGELGWLAAEKGRYEDALATFDDALRLDSTYVDALAGKAQILRRLGRLDEAETAILSAYERQPNNAWVITELGNVIATQERHEDALVAYNRALKFDANRVSAIGGKVQSLRLLGRIAEADEVVRDGLERHPDDEWLLTEFGWLADEQGRYHDSLAAFDQALTVDSANPSALVGKSQSLRLMGRLAEAEAVVQAGLANHPDDSGLLRQRGWLAIDERRDEDAVNAFSRILATDPDDEGAVVWKCRALSSLRRFTQAETGLRDFLKRHPGNPWVRNELGYLLYRQGRYEDVLPIADGTLSGDSLDRRARWLRRASLRRSLYLPYIRSLRRRVEENASALVSQRESELLSLKDVEAWEPATYDRIAPLLEQYWRRQARIEAFSEMWRGTVYRLRWTGSLILSFVVLVAVLVLFNAWLNPDHLLLASGMSAVSGVAAAGGLVGLIAIVVVRSKADWWPFILVGVYVLLAALAVTKFREITSSNWLVFGITVGVIAATVALLISLLLVGTLYFIAESRKRAADSDLPHMLVLSNLLQLLYEISYAPRRSDPAWRKRWVHNIETAANGMEKYFPRLLRGEDFKTDAWWVEKAAGMAAAMRDLKKVVMAPRPDTWGFLVAHVSEQLIYVGTGDWDKVSWQDPQPIMARERRQRLRNAGLLLAIALGPALGLWLFQLTPWAFEGTVIDQAIPIVVLWGAVSLLIRLDSQFREKLDIVQGVLSSPVPSKPKDKGAK